MYITLKINILFKCLRQENIGDNGKQSANNTFVSVYFETIKSVIFKMKFPTCVHVNVQLIRSIGKIICSLLRAH